MEEPATLLSPFSNALDTIASVLLKPQKEPAMSKAAKQNF